ncbi:YfhO family protein [Enterococcus ratti]|uniref:YfhO family protein n=1 Tax=Enterococcus ratti TaxID=150033 RepID=UPI0035116677
MRNFFMFLKTEQNFIYAGLSFIIPIIIMIIAYLNIGIFLGSDVSVLVGDGFTQSSHFHASFREVILGKQSIFYTWNASLGLNYLSLVSYYLSSLFAPLLLFFPNQIMPDTLYILTLLKIGSIGLSFWFLARTFKIPKWGTVAVSISYALMSFITVHSQLVMWMDSFIYLPLIFLGIHRLMDENKPKLLFFSYLLQFLSNFYFGFMTGIFSFLYFIMRCLTNRPKYKKSISSYMITSLLAAGSSMVITLPTFLDIKANGETLSKIASFKTEVTSYLDLIMKNMVGVYDTTKFGSIPFIYIGLFPLLLCLFYFFGKKGNKKEKWLYGSLFILLILSFYIEPLDLFWHGMHAPNMFLFRYAYLFSFLVLLIGCKGWEKIKEKDTTVLLKIGATLVLIYSAAYFFKPANSYAYVATSSYLLTVFFLGIYLLYFILYAKRKISFKWLCVFLLMAVTTESLINTSQMIQGISTNWNYAARATYTKPYPKIKELVDQTKEEVSSFYRLENIDPISANDSFNFGYSGINQFSSIRNRNSSSYLNQLGFKSKGTNLNIRYNNNTLLMDAFTGIKFNIAKNESSFNKYGFIKRSKNSDYTLYQNNNALPLAFIAPQKINELIPSVDDILSNQTNLFHALSGTEKKYFTSYRATLDTLKIREEKKYSQPLTWKFRIPANQQVYLNLASLQLSANTFITVNNGSPRKIQRKYEGQYYDLGYYSKETTVVFTIDSLLTDKPEIIGLDVNAYQEAVSKIKKKAVEINTTGRTATGIVHTLQDSMLVTTIPFDKGWKAQLDGKPVKIETFKDGFLMVKIPTGKHTIAFSYLPVGFNIGLLLFLTCPILFYLYLKTQETINKK